jgi:diguanylate cyclase (GGDEF)-like protein
MLASPLSEKTMGSELCEQITMHAVPELKRDLEPDYCAARTVHRIARMVSEDFPTIGDYVSRLMGEFEGADLCTVYVVPKNNTGAGVGLLEHRLSVYREGGEFKLDESPGAIENHGMVTQVLDNVLIERRPILIDYDLGIRIEFEDLDMDSDRCHVYRYNNGRRSGSLAVMPFYYREPVHPSGMVVFEGDLTCKGSKLEGRAKAYWTANTVGAAAAQISFQLTHKFDAITILSKYADFQVDFKQGIRQLTDRKIRNLHLLLVDLDDFKRINDTLGYEAGNEALRQVALAIKSCVRSGDRVARWGGEEFAVILTDVSEERALQVAERIRRRIAEVKVQGQKVTGSIGVADVGAVAEKVLEAVHGEAAGIAIYDRAFLVSDQNLKAAKKGGKNQVFMDAATTV